MHVNREYRGSQWKIRKGGFAWSWCISCTLEFWSDWSFLIGQRHKRQLQESWWNIDEDENIAQARTRAVRTKIIDRSRCCEGKICTSSHVRHSHAWNTSDITVKPRFLQRKVNTRQDFTDFSWASSLTFSVFTALRHLTSEAWFWSPRRDALNPRWKV